MNLSPTTSKLVPPKNEGNRRYDGKRPPDIGRPPTAVPSNNSTELGAPHNASHSENFVIPNSPSSNIPKPDPEKSEQSSLRNLLTGKIGGPRGGNWQVVDTPDGPIQIRKAT